MASVLWQENTEYVDAIIADVERLGLKFQGPITYTSDYFPQMLDLAEGLIKAGILYADDTPVEQMRAVSHHLPLLSNRASFANTPPQLLMYTAVRDMNLPKLLQ